MPHAPKIASRALGVIREGMVRGISTGDQAAAIRHTCKAWTRWSPGHQPHQTLDVVSLGCEAFADRPDPIEPEGIDRQAAQRHQDLNDVLLPIAVGAFA